MTGSASCTFARTLLSKSRRPNVFPLWQNWQNYILLFPRPYEERWSPWALAIWRLIEMHQTRFHCQCELNFRISFWNDKTYKLNTAVKRQLINSNKKQAHRAAVINRDSYGYVVFNNNVEWVMNLLRFNVSRRNLF